MLYERFRLWSTVVYGVQRAHIVATEQSPGQVVLEQWPGRLDGNRPDRRLGQLLSCQVESVPDEHVGQETVTSGICGSRRLQPRRPPGLLAPGVEIVYTRAVWTQITERETAATTAAHALREQIAALTDQLAHAEAEPADLATTRKVLTALTGQPDATPPVDATLAGVAYRHILAAFTAATHGLRAEAVCLALDWAPHPRTQKGYARSSNASSPARSWSRPSRACSPSARRNRPQRTLSRTPNSLPSQKSTEPHEPPSQEQGRPPRSPTTGAIQSRRDRAIQPEHQQEQQVASGRRE
jgi:hypothetical protein